jgi:hypothetical protein
MLCVKKRALSSEVYPKISALKIGLAHINIIYGGLRGWLFGKKM